MSGGLRGYATSARQRVRGVVVARGRRGRVAAAVTVKMVQQSFDPSSAFVQFSLGIQDSATFKRLLLSLGIPFAICTGLLMIFAAYGVRCSRTSMCVSDHANREHAGVLRRPHRFTRAPSLCSIAVGWQARRS